MGTVCKLELMLESYYLVTFYKMNLSAVFCPCHILLTQVTVPEISA